MAQVIWTKPALDNLDEIAEFIALSNPEAAANLVRRVFNGVDRLEQFPESGKIPIEIEEFKYREVVINPPRIFYKQQETHLYILFVLRQERDIRKYLLESQPK